MDNLLLDLTVTAHTSARTGIQRVALSLATTLTRRIVTTPVTYDPYEEDWRTLRPWERHNLTSSAKSWSRSARWPWNQKLLGTLRRVANTRHSPWPENAGLIAPESFAVSNPPDFPRLFSRIKGPKVAIFHDAIPLKLPALTPPATTARFPAYLQNLLQFDGVAADSEESCQSLLDYWRWAGWTDHPPVVAMPLGIDLPPPADEQPANANRRAQILSVGSLEGRKNHTALLAACETLWAEDLDFELHLIGLTQSQTGRAAAEQLRRLQASGRPLVYHGAVNDDFLNKAYASCTFTVYPSLMEGFGLPVLESLARGKPCVCLGHGALGESARGGGCLALPDVTAPTLAGAIRELLTAPATLQHLEAEARARCFRTWADYTDDLLGWMGTLTRRSS